MSDLIAKFGAWHDPLMRGCTQRGLAAGLPVLRGFAWPLIDGAYLLLAAASKAALSLDRPAGAAPAQATSIRPFSWADRQPSTTTYYQLVAIGPGGVPAADPGRSLVTRVTTDAEGDALLPVPPAPRELHAAAIAGGKVRLRWLFTPSAHFARAASFAVYTDAGTGTIDEETPAATVPVALSRSGEGVYQWDSPAFAHDTETLWIVRARTAAGAEERNVVAVSAISDAEGPASARIVAAAYGADE